MKKGNLSVSDKAGILGQVFELAITTKKPLKHLLVDLFTPAEIDDFWQRWNILTLLNQGKTQREVAEELKISISKVSRGARVLEDGSETLRKILKKP